MQYREDRRSGNQLSILGFGCMRLPSSMGQIDKEKTEMLLLKAFESGINYYDTAYMYAGSEEVVGEIFEKHGLREKVYIATKFPQFMCMAVSDFDHFFEIQMRRLRTEYIDYYLMHNITDFSQWEKLIRFGVVNWVEAKKKSGEIRNIGFSFHGSHSDFIKLLQAYPWDFVQIQYNYIDIHNQAGIEGLKRAALMGLSVFVMEPLLGGKLVRLPEEALTILKQAKKEATPASWALNWVWNDKDVTVLLSGMNELSQLEENIKLADAVIPDSFTEADEQVIEHVKAIFNKNYKIPCTGCNYCMPCPKKINIPACFDAYNTSYVVGRSAGMKQYMTSVGALGDVPHYASDCIECGKCAKNCPQKIDIPKQLKAVRHRLQFPGMKLATGFMTKHSNN